MVQIADINIALAVAAGLVSFLSPCCLPLVPGYLASISGAAAEGDSPAPMRMALFLAGFGATFIVLGLTASALGQAAATYRPELSLISGALVIGIGLAMLLSLRPRLPFASSMPRAAQRLQGSGPLLVGVGCAVAWTPCIGPTLGAILFVAAGGGSLSEGLVLLVAYTVGLMIPFVIAGAAYQRGFRGLRALSRHRDSVRIAGALTLIAMGALLVSDRMYYVNIALQRLASSGPLDFWQSV